MQKGDLKMLFFGLQDGPLGVKTVSFFFCDVFFLEGKDPELEDEGFLEGLCTCFSERRDASTIGMTIKIKNKQKQHFQKPYTIKPKTDQKATTDTQAKNIKKQKPTKSNGLKPTITKHLN